MTARPKAVTCVRSVPKSIAAQIGARKRQHRPVRVEKRRSRLPALKCTGRTSKSHPYMRERWHDNEFVETVY